MEAVLQREPQFALYEAGGGKTPMKRGASGGPGAGEKAPVSQALHFPPSAPHSLMAQPLQASLVGEGRVDTRGNLRPKLLAPCGAERNGVKGATWRRQPSAFGAGAGKASRVTEPQGAGSFQGTYFLSPLGTDRLRGTGTGSGREPAQLGSPPPAPNTSQHKRPSGFMVYGWQSVGTRSLSSRQKSAVASRSWEVTHGGLIQATQLEKAVSQ